MRSAAFAPGNSQMASEFGDPRGDRPRRLALVGKSNPVIPDRNANNSVVLGGIDGRVARVAVAQRVAHAFEHDLKNLFDHEAVGGKGGLDAKAGFRNVREGRVESLVKVGQRANICSDLVELP